MGLFDSVRRNRELEKLEREAAQNPSPLTLSTLAERYIAFGETEKSLEVAKKAVEAFPDSERVVTTYRYIMRTHLQARIAELQKSIDKNPTPTGFGRLAELHYKDLGDRDTAMEICRRGLAMYPRDEGLHMIQGKIRADRFHEDFQAKDGMQAVEHLERVAKLNPQNYKALIHLSKLYLEVGAYAHAQATVEMIRRVSPEDETARTMLEQLSGLPKRDLATEDVDLQFREVEARGGLDEAGKAQAARYDTVVQRRPLGAAFKLDAEKLAPILRKFDELDGLIAAMVVTADGRPISAHGAGGAPLDRLAQIAHAIYLTSEDASKRMDIGAFQRGTIEGAFGRLHLVMFRQLLLCVFTNLATKNEPVANAIERVLDALAKTSAALEKV